QSQGGDTPTQSAQPVIAANQKPDAPTPAPFSPSGQPQAGVLQQPDPKLIPSLQQYTWYPQGGSPLIMPMQPICLVNSVIPLTLRDLPLPCLFTVSFLSLLFQMAATMGQLGVYMPTVLTNQPAGAVQARSQAAGLKNPEQPGVQPAVGTSAAGGQQIQGLPCAGSQTNANGVPAGLAGAAPSAATAQPQLQPTQRTLV
uniref:Uncharacterized protein n=1 Tax=Amphilophus citrinellus TaxID=61819 RepID=A0A3Q0QYK3_AMPCI